VSNALTVAATVAFLLLPSCAQRGRHPTAEEASSPEEATRTVTLVLDSAEAILPPIDWHDVRVMLVPAAEGKKLDRPSPIEIDCKATGAKPWFVSIESLVGSGQWIATAELAAAYRGETALMVPHVPGELAITVAIDLTPVEGTARYALPIEITFEPEEVRDPEIEYPLEFHISPMGDRNHIFCFAKRFSPGELPCTFTPTVRLAPGRYHAIVQNADATLFGMKAFDALADGSISNINMPWSKGLPVAISQFDEPLPTPDADDKAPKDAGSTAEPRTPGVGDSLDLFSPAGQLYMMFVFVEKARDDRDVPRLLDRLQLLSRAVRLPLYTADPKCREVLDEKLPPVRGLLNAEDELVKIVAAYTLMAAGELEPKKAMEVILGIDEQKMMAQGITFEQARSAALRHLTSSDAVLRTRALFFSTLVVADSGKPSLYDLLTSEDVKERKLGLERVAESTGQRLPFDPADIDMWPPGEPPPVLKMPAAPAREPPEETAD
jgi:hypothetical protein